jgi:hypothetical protein
LNPSGILAKSKKQLSLIKQKTMSFFSKLFGKDRNEASSSSATKKPEGPTPYKPQEKPRVPGEEPPPSSKLKWIEANDNQWGTRVLDMTPVTQHMTSTSQDPKMARNAVSYSTEDGVAFWKIAPANKTLIDTHLTIVTDTVLLPGVVFSPRQMEHKWAIYFDGNYLIFVRSWLREVTVIAKTTQQRNELIITKVQGVFTANETPAFTEAVLMFLLVSHGLGEIAPAPLPDIFQSDPDKAALWAFSTYGNKAQAGVFGSSCLASSKTPLRSHSLLHIAVARGDADGIDLQLKWGVGINALAGDGLATLHWSVANHNTEMMEKLLDLGADPNVMTDQGATPIMNAVQSNKPEHIRVLLKAGALINFTDHRGFTALHRAAEMGNTSLVKLLLKAGADKSIIAEGHTALSLAKGKGEQAVVELLS